MLEHVAEAKEAPVQGPPRPCNKAGNIGFVAFAAQEDYSLRNCLLTWVGVGINALDCRLRDTIAVAKTTVNR